MEGSNDPLPLLLLAQQAYHKEQKNPEWITLIATKRALESISVLPTSNSSPTPSESSAIDLPPLSKSDPLIPPDLFSLHNVNGDGSCTFHAISHQLQILDWPSVTYRYIRRETASWLAFSQFTRVPLQNPLPLYQLADTVTFDTDEYI